MRIHALLLLAVGLQIAADQPSDDAIKKEMKKLDGTWVVQSVVRDPREKGEGEGKDLRIIISGVNAVVKAAGEDKTLGKAAIKIDPTKKPKTIDITGEGEMAAVLGIYELERDTLRVCWGPSEKMQRPTQLTSKPGSGQSLVVLKRGKPPTATGR